MKIQRCKGAKDWLPQDMVRFRFIEDIFRNCCTSCGYREVRTPTLEYLHLFTAAGTLTPSRLSKVYSFLDWDGWSGERVVLRPDGTIPAARLYIDNLAELEITRLFYVTNVFVFEETGKESRERWQCGVELLGSAETMAEVEIILLASEILHNFGFTNIELRLSHAGVVRALIKELRLSPDRETEVLDQILDGNWQVLVEGKPIGSKLDDILSLLLKPKGKPASFLENLRAASAQVSSDLESNLENFLNVIRLLDAMGYKYRVDITATRSFEYYTGVCFQFLVKGKRVGGGGRYDNLIPLVGGKSTPACGFALYIDPLMTLILPRTGEKIEQGVSIRCEGVIPEMMKSCFHLAQSLRNAGCVAELDPTGRDTSRRWVISIRETGLSPFVIIDQVQDRKKEATSIDEVINIVKGSA